MSLTTKQQLAAATTPAARKAAITLAKARGWTDASIARHLPAEPVAQQVAEVAYRAPQRAPKRSRTERALAGLPLLTPAPETIPVVVESMGTPTIRYSDTLHVQARAKKRGTGTTHTAWLAATPQKHTMSTEQLGRLKAGRTVRFPMGERLYLLTLA